jgi:SAM-dependent methyltransferase
MQPGGRALDLACGRGRNALYLASLGLHVLAVDRDVDALEPLRGHKGVIPLKADLEGGAWPLPGLRFDAVVVTRYLHRPILADVVAAVDEGGLLLYETFMRGQEALGKPTNPDFLLEPGELLRACAGLKVVAFEEGPVEGPRPAVLQRICAVRS